MGNSPEYSFEELLIQKLDASGNYDAGTFLHKGTHEKSDKSKVYLSATRGAKRFDGAQGFSLTCTISVETLVTKTSEEEADELCKNITADIYSSAPVNYDLPGVTFASVEPDAECLKKSTSKMTIRHIMVSGILKN